MSEFLIIENDGVLLVDSRLIASRLGIEHDNFMQTVYTYQSLIEKEFGIILFQTGEIEGRGRPQKFAFVTEDQSFFLMTLSRNTPEVIQCKVDLVKSFSKAKELLRRREQTRSSRIPYWYQRTRIAMSDTTKPLQAGYFCIYQAMMDPFVQLEIRLNYIVPDTDPKTGKHLVPNISIALMLNKFLRSDDELAVWARREFLGSGDIIDFRSDGSHDHEIVVYNHVYPISSHGQYNIQEANSYPTKYMSLFQYFLEEYWIPENCIPYLMKRDREGVEYIRFAYNQLDPLIRESLQGTLLAKLTRRLPPSI
jgi:phage regulator Rha-like protein